MPAFFPKRGLGLAPPSWLLLCVAALAHASDLPLGPFQPATYQIDTVGSKDRVVGKFMLRNVGRQELVLRSVRRNCACYLISHTDNRLQPGESMTLTFDLTFPEGKRLRNAVFYILSNDREKPLRLFKIKLQQSDDPDFAASQPDQLILQPLDESLATMDDLEATNFTCCTMLEAQLLGFAERREHADALGGIPPRPGRERAAS